MVLEDDCRMAKARFEQLKTLIKVAKEIHPAEKVCAEIYSMFQDYCISEKQEGMLYKVVDPKDRVSNPAEIYFKSEELISPLHDFASGDCGFIEAIRRLVK